MNTSLLSHMDKLFGLKPLESHGDKKIVNGGPFFFSTKQISAAGTQSVLLCQAAMHTSSVFKKPLTKPLTSGLDCMNMLQNLV